jgi:hypothetical protein
MNRTRESATAPVQRASTNRTRAIGIAGVCLLGAGIAAAGLRDAPAPGVALTGSWQLDPAKSDDAQAVIDKARDALIDSRANSGGLRGGGHFAGAEEAFPAGGGGMTRGGMGGGGLGGGGSWGHNATPAADDPLGGGADSDAAAGGESRDRTGNAFLTELERNPQLLAFAAADREVKVVADESEIGCEPGGTITLSDRLGDGERQCGWQGRAWVIETTRPRSGSRIDRYEFSRNGRSVTYTTLVTGGQMPRIKLTRVYNRVTSSTRPALQASGTP